MPIHLLLDWSGTLCDDMATTRIATNSVIKSLGGVEATPEEYRREFRLPAHPFYTKRIRPESCPSAERIDELFSNAMRMAKPAPLFPGVREFVQYALDRGGSARVVSSLPQAELDKSVRHGGVQELFTEVIGGVRDKTAALPGIVERAGLSPDDCLMLGDMVHDLQAARAARVRACAILHGYTPPEQLLDEHPDEVWRDLHEARAWLERHLMLETRSWPIATVGGLVFRDDGRAFFVKTAKWSGKWGTPGGKIDYGEGHLDAFVREIREETGIGTVDPELVLVQDAIEEPEFVRPRHFLLLNMTGRADPSTDSDTRLNHESIDGGWFTLEEAADLDLNRPTRVLVEFLKARRKGA